MQWAQAAGLPVSVHNRSADADVLAVLSEVEVLTVLHCFCSSKDFADQALSAGCYLSFAGNVTYPKADELRQVSAVVPADRILVESDAPVLAPQSARGHRNEPSSVRDVAEVIAAERGEPLEALCRRVTQTAAGLFSWTA